MGRDELIEAMARAAYIAHHRNGPTDEAFDEPNMGRGGFKTEVIVWHAVAQAALSALEAQGLVVSQGWQPIETAKVGEVVWAYGTIEGDYGYTEDRKDIVKAVKEPTGKWRFAQPMGRHDPLFWQPDAWMPLPLPPIAAAGGEG